MSKKKKIGGLIAALIAVVGLGVLFMFAVAGVFSNQITALDDEYYCEGKCESEFEELTEESYEKLIEEKKSFVVFVDQIGCDTADKLRGFSNDYFSEQGVKIYKMMFSVLKETSLHEKVKYYPSVVVISKGTVKTFLRADSDEDAKAFNEYGSFIDWVNKRVKFNN